MLKPLRTLLFAGLISLAAAGTTGISQQHSFENITPARVWDDLPLSVMTYNIKGLPWPLATGRADAMDRIAGRLIDLRCAGRQPHIVLLQEAFTEEAAAIARTAGYAHVAFGPDIRTRSPVMRYPADEAYVREARWD